MNESKIFNLKEIPKNIFKDRWVKFAFGPQGIINSKNLNFGIVNFSPNKKSLNHNHNVEEALFIISGKGKIQIAGEIFKIKNNDFIYIPNDTDHLIITSKENLKILFIFGGGIAINK